MANTIPWHSLAWCLLPVALVVWLFYRFKAPTTDVLHASARMFVQLIAVGYILVLIFNQPSWWISALVLLLMMSVASWIALRPVRQYPGLLLPGMAALGSAVLLHLALSIALVIDVSPWYTPNVLIPLAGMYFANTMNSISLSAERYYSERKHGANPEQAANSAFSASMIPQINGLFAVGLVALPGMMTGQILSGVSPLIAVRYQVMIMTMLLGATGLGSAMMLWLLKARDIRQSDA